jgi:hypothetical protein
MGTAIESARLVSLMPIELDKQEADVRGRQSLLCFDKVKRGGQGYNLEAPPIRPTGIDLGT